MTQVTRKNCDEQFFADENILFLGLFLIYLSILI